MFMRHMLTPPIICGLLLSGFAAGNACRFTERCLASGSILTTDPIEAKASTRSPSDSDDADQKKEGLQENLEEDLKEDSDEKVMEDSVETDVLDSDDSAIDDPRERVLEIMRASAEGTIKILTGLIND